MHPAPSARALAVVVSLGFAFLRVRCAAIRQLQLAGREQIIHNNKKRSKPKRKVIKVFVITRMLGF
jgi:hypothetical protein